MTISVKLTVGEVPAGRKVIVTAAEGGKETQIVSRLVSGESADVSVRPGYFLRLEEALDDQVQDAPVAEVVAQPETEEAQLQEKPSGAVTDLAPETATEA